MKIPASNSYENIYGLSCMENQIGALMSENGFPLSLLYYTAFLSLDELAHVFLGRQVDFAHFDGVERIQDMLRKLHVISMALQKDAEEAFALEIKQFHDAVLILLNQEYAKETFLIRGWHEKHYALLFQEDGQFYLQNDIPFIKQKVVPEQARLFYGGEFFTIELHRQNFPAVIAYLKTIKPEIQLASETDLELCPNQIVPLRDLAGVYRILLRRQKAFCETRINADVYVDFIKEADAIYMRMEYLNLKGVTCGEPLTDLWGKLKTIEESAQAILQKEGICITKR